MAAGGPRHPRKEEAVLGGKLFMGFRTHITHVQQHPSRGHTQDPPEEKGSGGSRGRDWGVHSPLGSLCLVPEGPAPPPALWPHVLGAPMPLGSPLPPGESCVPGGSTSPLIHPLGLGGLRGLRQPPAARAEPNKYWGGLQFRGAGMGWHLAAGAGGCPPSGGSGESGGPMGGRSP